MSGSHLLKVLGAGAESIHGGTGTWHKPVGKRPGKWMPKIANPECCERGYHLVTITRVPEWLRPDCTIWLAEGRGEVDVQAAKTAWEQARLLRRLSFSERDMRLFAADCAQHVLPLFEKKRPTDDRPRKAIEAARAYARGEIAAAAAAAAAARAAAAAYAGNYAGGAWRAAAAAAAVGEREWQGARLAEYLGLTDPEAAS